MRLVGSGSGGEPKELVLVKPSMKLCSHASIKSMVLII